MKGAWDGTSNRTKEEYIVMFDNMTLHHCRTLRDAIEFGEQMGGTSIYGRPFEVYKVTTVSTRTYELVQRFDFVQDEYEESRDFEGFTL